MRADAPTPVIMLTARARRPIASWAWSSVPTTTSRSRSRRARWSPASAPCCAGRSRERRPRWRCLRSATCRSTADAARCASAIATCTSRARSSTCSTTWPRRPGITFTRTALLEAVWDFAWDGDTATVTVHIRRLREKIEDDPSAPATSDHGVGRRLPVRAMRGTLRAIALVVAGRRRWRRWPRWRVGAPMGMSFGRSGASARAARRVHGRDRGHRARANAVLRPDVAPVPVPGRRGARRRRRAREPGRHGSSSCW